jgi:hypothetical protein
MNAIQVSQDGDLHNTRIFSLQGLFGYFEEETLKIEGELRKALFRETQLQKKIAVTDRPHFMEPCPAHACKPFILVELSRKLEENRRRIEALEKDLKLFRATDCKGSFFGQGPLPDFCIGQFDLPGPKYNHSLFIPGEQHVVYEEGELYN